MPSLGGATGWLNSEPLGPAELRGHVVLVDFWTLTCINWLRTEPYVRAWSQAYRDDGLVVIGVHTPEFSFEHEIDRVRQATKERGIDYPVALDNDYAIWSAFDNHYWPALYFVDADGVIRDHHFGEGRYEQSERVIQRLLGVERELVPVEGLGVEAEADWDHLGTPETYLGYARGEHFACRGRVRRPRLPAARAPAPTIGPWPASGRSGPRTSCSRSPAGASPTGSTRATRTSCCRPGAEPIPFRVLLDGEAPGRVTRRGRRRGRERRRSRTAGCTSSCACTTRSASGPWRSRSWSPARRRTCSHSARSPAGRSQGADQGFHGRDPRRPSATVIPTTNPRRSTRCAPTSHPAPRSRTTSCRITRTSLGSSATSRATTR